MIGRIRSTDEVLALLRDGWILSEYRDGGYFVQRGRLGGGGEARDVAAYAAKMLIERGPIRAVGFGVNRHYVAS